jgi:hypothetical protein
MLDQESDQEITAATRGVRKLMEQKGLLEPKAEKPGR